MKPMLLILALCLPLAAREYPDRWFYLSRSLRTDEDVETFRTLCTTASQHGFSGVCWAGLEGVARFSDEQLQRLATCRRIAADLKLEIIPLLFSVGYGGSALGYDRNLAVGFPVDDLRFKVDGQAASFVPETDVGFANPGFEEFKDNRPTGWQFADKPGEVSFIDPEVKHSGNASLRLENPVAKGLGQHARAMQRIPVKPHRNYRLRIWIKADGTVPESAFRLQVYGGEKGPNIVAWNVRGSTFDWRLETFQFNSLDYDQVRLYAGTWGGQSGRFWFDDASLEPLGLNNVLRRDGCPLTVRSADGATTFEEGRDYEPIADPQLLRFTDRPSPTITLTANSRIKDGETLQVSCYTAGQVADRQVSVCMSAPGLYEHYEQVSAKLAEVLPSSKFLLSMDEIRQGGTDLADQQRGLTMGEILADCITRQEAILRQHHPDATIYIWSDMLDPEHNGHGDYYQVQGDWSGAWEKVPKDLVIACWWGKQCERSLQFFESHGFRTLGAAYYDADNLDGSRQWLEALAKTPHATGIMYTTWRNKYELLGPFGDLVRESGR